MLVDLSYHGCNSQSKNSDHEDDAFKDVAAAILAETTSKGDSND